MTRQLLLMSSVMLVLLAVTVYAGWPTNVTEVKTEKGKTITVKGDLANGTFLEDLSWAANSAVACFPATQNLRFQGHHVLYATLLPPTSIMKITVTPDDVNQDMSIYAYQIGTNNFSVVPKLSSCVTCEAEYKWDRPKKGKSQDHTRTVQLNSAKSPYNVVIGVSGPKEAVSGKYTLTIELK